MPRSSLFRKSRLLAEVLYLITCYTFLLPKDLEDYFSLCIFIYERRLFVINIAAYFQTHVCDCEATVSFFNFLFKQKLPFGLLDKMFVQERLQQLSWAASVILAMSRSGIFFECILNAVLLRSSSGLYWVKAVF